MQKSVLLRGLDLLGLCPWASLLDHEGEARGRHVWVLYGGATPRSAESSVLRKNLEYYS